MYRKKTLNSMFNFKQLFSPQNKISVCPPPKKKTWNINFELFLHMLKSEIIRMRIGQIIRLKNYMDLSQTPYTSQIVIHF